MHYEYMWLYQIFYEWLINFLVFDKRQVMNLLSVSCVAKQIGRQQYILNFMLEKIKFKGSIRVHTHTCTRRNTPDQHLHLLSHSHLCSLPIPHTHLLSELSDAHASTRTCIQIYIHANGSKWQINWICERKKIYMSNDTNSNEWFI